MRVGAPSYKIIGNVRGMLLLDAILAMTILAGSLMVIIQCLTQGLQAAAFISTYTQATLVAENKWFQVMAQPPLSGATQESETVSQNGRDFKVLLGTQKSGLPGNDNLYKFDLKISWVSGIQEHELESARYVFQPDGQKM